MIGKQLLTCSEAVKAYIVGCPKDGRSRQAKRCAGCIGSISMCMWPGRPHTWTGSAWNGVYCSGPTGQLQTLLQAIAPGPCSFPPLYAPKHPIGRLCRHRDNSCL